LNFVLFGFGRDLKPAHVLVTLYDGVPVPKIIDFGIAKAINQRLTEKTLFTSFRLMIGTPLYMSPEQAEMSGLDVDTRSDIYSLGVVPYEMLTVNKRVASVTPNAASKTYGAADPNPQTTGTLNNFVAADHVTATYNRTPGEAVGTYPISAALSPESVPVGATWVSGRRPLGRHHVRHACQVVRRAGQLVPVHHGRSRCP
jgi:serine/threonine protein kinase